MRMPKTPEANEHPARKAARLSRTYFAQRRKEDWLGLWAETGEIRDPINGRVNTRSRGYRFQYS